MQEAGLRAFQRFGSMGSSALECDSFMGPNVQDLIKEQVEKKDKKSESVTDADDEGNCDGDEKDLDEEAPENKSKVWDYETKTLKAEKDFERSIA
eukprot:33539-Amphidinium_carterae.1